MTFDAKSSQVLSLERDKETLTSENAALLVKKEDNESRIKNLIESLAQQKEARAQEMEIKLQEIAALVAAKKGNESRIKNLTESLSQQKKSSSTRKGN